MAARILRWLRETSSGVQLTFFIVICSTLPLVLTALNDTQCATSNCTNVVEYPSTSSDLSCICDRGWTLSNGSCVDVNECLLDHGICDQRCKNLNGSYECFCDDGYKLQPDNYTCKAEGDAALLVFCDVDSVQAYDLKSGNISKIAVTFGYIKGVDYDGNYIYWTNETSYDKNIMRSEFNSSNPQRIVSLGYRGAPKDVAVDWITNNIYFTVEGVNVIGVCSADGGSCAAIAKTKATINIALNPSKRTLYWVEKDTGIGAQIISAGMDGSNPVAILDFGVADTPTDTTFDFHNDRIYWVNPEKGRIESIKLDSSGHRVVFKHPTEVPYSLTVFEDRLYWSWANENERSTIHSCHKFTCTNHSTIVVNDDVAILDRLRISMRKQNVHNTCESSSCAQMCVLAPNNKGYACVCREGSILNDDMKTCRAANNTDILFVGAGQTLVRIELRIFGDFSFTRIHLNTIQDIGPITFHSLQGKVILYDTIQKYVYSYDPNSERLEVIVSKGVGNITDMDYDYLAGNLYWIDSEKRTVELMSLKTLQQTVLRPYLMDVPVSMALSPQENALFVAFHAENFHITRYAMNGEYDKKVQTFLVEVESQGPPFSMTYEPSVRYIFWTDSQKIGITDLRLGIDEYKEFDKPASDITILHDYFFWVQGNSNHIRWIHTSGVLRTRTVSRTSKKIDVGLDHDIGHPHMVAVRGKLQTSTHTCHEDNGNCSHICISEKQKNVCACPEGLNLQQDGRNCHVSLPVPFAPPANFSRN